jgi:hypothetical protein
VKIFNFFRYFVQLSFLFFLLPATSAPVQLSEGSTIGVLKTANYRNIQAKLYYVEEKASINTPRIKVLRQRKPVYDEVLSIDEMKYFAKIAPPVLIDFDGDWEPEILVDVSSERTNCCNYSIIYTYDPKIQSYTKTSHFWGNGIKGRHMQDLDKDGTPEFISQDARFINEQDDEDNSARPIRIWHYGSTGDMIDVTRQYPSFIYADAVMHWERFEQANKVRKPDQVLVKDVLRAYLADKYLLGQEVEGWGLVKEAYRAKGRQKYFDNLQKFLDTNGYSKKALIN